MEELEKIKEIMGHLLLCQTGKNGAWRPSKWTTKQQCYDALGAIQTLLKSNAVRCDEEFMRGRLTKSTDTGNYKREI